MRGLSIKREEREEREEEMKRNWVAEEIKGKRTGWVDRSRTTVPGTEVWEFIHSECPMPIGTLTIRWVGLAAVEILYVFVMERYRRCGIATRLLNEVAVKHPALQMVFTGEGSRGFGEPWLKKLNFEKAGALGWKLEIPGREIEQKVTKKSR